MQNIEAILKQFNIEVPKEQSEEFRKVFHENYKTVKDYEKVESDRDKWKGQAETAEETLKKFDGVDLETMKTELDTWKQKAETAENDYKMCIRDRSKTSVKSMRVPYITSGIFWANGRLPRGLYIRCSAGKRTLSAEKWNTSEDINTMCLSTRCV